MSAGCSRYTDHCGQRRSHEPRHAAEYHRESQSGEHHQVGYECDDARAGYVVGEVGLRQQAAERDGGGGEAQRVTAAAPVDPGHEQCREQQVEDHLVRQRPHHVGQVGPREDVRHHQHLGQHRRFRVGVLAPQAAEVGHPQGHREPDSEQVQGVEPEDPAHPERPHAALALQRRRHDIAADEEEDEDTVIAGVEPLVDGPPDSRGHEGTEVVEDHAQRRHSAEHVQPCQPAWCPSCAADGRLRGHRGNAGPRALDIARLRLNAACERSASSLTDGRSLHGRAVTAGQGRHRGQGHPAGGRLGAFRKWPCPADCC